MTLKLILREVLTHHLDNGFGAPETQQFGSNLSAQYAPGNANGYPDTAKSDGVIGKATYILESKRRSYVLCNMVRRFRPGLLNRPVGSSNAAGTYRCKPEVKSDEVTNLSLVGRAVLKRWQLRFNGSAFMVDVRDFKELFLIQVLLTYSSQIMQQMLK